MTQQVSELEKELAQFKNWDAEKQRYMLTDYGSGTFAYALKKEQAMESRFIAYVQIALTRS